MIYIGNKGFQVKSFSIPFFFEVSLMAQLKKQIPSGNFKGKARLNDNKLNHERKR